MLRRFSSITRLLLLSGIGFIPLCSDASAQAPTVDNSKVNKTPGTTADRAQNGLSDREVMRKIRQDVVRDKSLSTYGHNVKIVAQHGKVTLRGPVRSDDEKATIEKYAEKIAGDGNVTNDLTVKTDSK